LFFKALLTDTFFLLSPVEQLLSEKQKKSNSEPLKRKIFFAIAKTCSRPNLWDNIKILWSYALKGQNRSAQGNALGNETNKYFKP